MRCRAEKVMTALLLAAATHWLRTFFFVMADVKVVESAFLKGKVSVPLGEGQSERQVSRKVGVKVESGRRRKTESDRLIVTWLGKIPLCLPQS